ncbi:hypothetical protein [Actinoplanes sp. NPDC049118]|uniref:hypothetical protein n=1 Tax=Actinoplanes sp. NPDC049118 TaxID=3155769 RepID=UPI0033F6BEFB
MSSDDTSVPDAADQQGSALTRLLRDVGINVVANLIAAAIVYLLGAVAGLFPKNAAVVAVAAIFLAFTGSVSLMIAALASLRHFRRGRRFSQRKVATTMLLTSGSYTACGLFLFLLPISSPGTMNPLALVLYVPGAFMIALGLSAIRQYAKERRKRPESEKDDNEVVNPRL